MNRSDLATFASHFVRWAEATFTTISTRVNVRDKDIAMGAGKIDVKPLITDRLGFDQSIRAFDLASNMPPESVKVQIEMPA